MKSIYLIGSLRNENVPIVGQSIRAAGFEVFDEWYSAGKIADDSFKEYFQSRGITYDEALNSYAARHIFNFDKRHLDRCDAVVLVCPAGRSGHLELGYSIGRNKPAYILIDENTANDRWDLMLQFADKVTFSVEALVGELHNDTRLH